MEELHVQPRPGAQTKPESRGCRGDHLLRMGKQLEEIEAQHQQVTEVEGMAIGSKLKILRQTPECRLSWMHLLTVRWSPS